MAYTYVDCVNKVLRRLRESQVGTVNASAYSSLIGEFVNDAKRVVEDSWNWGVLRSIVTFNLTASVLDYNLADAGVSTVAAPSLRPNERSVLLYEPDGGAPLAWDVTSGNSQSLCVSHIDLVEREVRLNPPVTNATPSDFGIYTYPDELHVKLYETPTATRNWCMIFKRPQNDLEDEDDVLRIPYLPVILLATNYALNERGEEIGMAGSEAEKKYGLALSDAIALDTAQYGRTVTWIPE